MRIKYANQFIGKFTVHHFVLVLKQSLIKIFYLIFNILEC